MADEFDKALEEYMDSSHEALVRMEAEIAAQLADLANFKRDLTETQVYAENIPLIEPPKLPTLEESIRVIDTVDHSDGSVSMTLHMAYADLVLFAEIGLKQVIIDAAKRTMEECSYAPA